MINYFKFILYLFSGKMIITLKHFTESWVKRHKINALLKTPRLPVFGVVCWVFVSHYLLPNNGSNNKNEWT